MDIHLFFAGIFLGRFVHEPVGGELELLYSFLMFGSHVFFEVHELGG